MRLLDHPREYRALLLLYSQHDLQSSSQRHRRRRSQASAGLPVVSWGEPLVSMKSRPAQLRLGDDRQGSHRIRE